jgi:hypothetical protein
MFWTNDTEFSSQFDIQMIDLLKFKYAKYQGINQIALEEYVSKLLPPDLNLYTSELFILFFYFPNLKCIRSFNSCSAAKVHIEDLLSRYQYALRKMTITITEPFTVAFNRQYTVALYSDSLAFT